MADRIIPEITAVAHFVEVADSEGRLVLLPRAMVDAMRAAGQTSVTLMVSLTAEPPREWLTVSEAARLFMTDVDGMTFENAQSRISRACTAGQIVNTGAGTLRRIEPTSLDAWRLTQREKNLARCDD